MCGYDSDADMSWVTFDDTRSDHDDHVMPSSVQTDQELQQQQQQREEGEVSLEGAEGDEGETTTGLDDSTELQKTRDEIAKQQALDKYSAQLELRQYIISTSCAAC